jgi:aryl-alcohol dehydrogenase-like predicted oxidoreductase
MRYQTLGRTGLQVSAVAVGTVSLGVDRYGIEVPGEFGWPGEQNAVNLIRQAVDQGINLFDTAPAYGESERLLGQALTGSLAYVATKVAVPKDRDNHLLTGTALPRAIMESVDASLRNLGREALDIVQIHNATVEVIDQGEMALVLMEARDRGKIRALGASVYTEAEALAAIRAGCFEVLQVPYNLLDQEMAGRVFPAAARQGVGLMVRSAFLKGVLSAKAQWLPPEMARLRQAAESLRDTLEVPWEALPETALRFCLSAPEVATVLVGLRTVEELDAALQAAARGPLPEALMTRTPGLALTDRHLVNPSYWPVP